MSSLSENVLTRVNSEYDDHNCNLTSAILLPRKRETVASRYEVVFEEGKTELLR